MPENNSDSVSRGRTQAAKPLTTTGASFANPTASTRAKSKPQSLAAANSSADKRPTGGASSTAANATQKTGVPCQNATEKEPGVPDASANPRSQALEAPLQQEPLKEVTRQETTVFTPSGDVEKDKDKSAQLSVAPEASEGTPSEATEAKTSSPSRAAETPAIPPTAEPLQVAAQTYPWLYMSSTLDACFAKSEKMAKKELDDLEKQVTEDEAELAEEKTLYESERIIEFCNELGSDPFAKEAPAIMQSFTSFGEVCERVEAEALQLAMSSPSLESEEPLQAFSAMMDQLEKLQEQGSELESSILRLTEQSSAFSTVEVSTTVEEGKGNDVEKKQQLTEDANWGRDQIIGVFAACLPVLRARVANLSMAQELIDSAQENFSLALRMESMGIE